MWMHHKFICLLWLFVTVFGGSIFAQETLEVKGRVILPGKEKFPGAGLAVVLLKFVLDEKGQLRTDGPIGRTQTQESGEFKFEPIPLETKAAYQVSSLYQEQMIRSQHFFLKPGQKIANIDIVVPGISEKTEALEIANAALFIEPGIGMLKITEVLTIINPSNDIIDTRKNPLIFDLPESYTQFDQLHRSSSASKDYELLGQKLQFHRQFPSGETPLLFSYVIPVTFGSYVLQKNYPPSLKAGRVLTPLDQLVLESPQLKLSKVENFGEVQLEAWEMTNPKQSQLKVHIGSIPVKQTVYGYIGIAILIVLMLLVFGFIRFRL